MSAAVAIANEFSQLAVKAKNLGMNSTEILFCFVSAGVCIRLMDCGVGVEEVKLVSMEGVPRVIDLVEEIVWKAVEG